jgi:hypothetical protein
MITALITVERDADGKPDLDLPSSVTITKESPDFYHVRWRDYWLTLYRLGVYPGTGQLVWLGAGTRDVLTKLSHLGAAVYPLHQALSKPAVRTWLRDVKGLRGIRRISDGVVVGILPPVVLAGTNPIAAGLGDTAEEGEEYEVV